jgi:hypothetical protein
MINGMLTEVKAWMRNFISHLSVSFQYNSILTFFKVNSSILFPYGINKTDMLNRVFTEKPGIKIYYSDLQKFCLM